MKSLIVFGFFVLIGVSASFAQDYPSACVPATDAAAEFSDRLLYSEGFVSVYPNVCKQQCSALLAGCKKVVKSSAQCAASEASAVERWWNALCTNAKGKEAEKSCRDDAKRRLAAAKEALKLDVAAGLSVCTSEQKECLDCGGGGY